MLIRLSLQVFFFHNRDALSFVRPARFAGEKDFKDAVTQPWFRLPRAGEHAFKGPVFEDGSGLPRACENVLKGSLSDSGRAGEPMLKRLVSEFGSRSTRAGELVLKGAVSESGSRVTRPGGSGDAAVSETAAHATAGESEEIIGLHVSHSSFDNSSNSLGCVAAVACARLPAVPSVSARVCAVSSSSAVSAAVAHARSTPMHDAHNSRSDMVRSQGPTGRRCTKGGVSGPAEDLRPVPEVEAGVNFRPAGRVRRQVASSLPNKGSVVTPSLHPEVPDSLFMSPGPGKRIRQLMGWTKVCGTTQSGIWVLKGNARTCMFPANLAHLRVGIQDRLGYARARLSVSIQVWTWSSSQTTN